LTTGLSHIAASSTGKTGLGLPQGGSEKLAFSVVKNPHQGLKPAILLAIFAARLKAVP
jgi:hypothetical protein